MLKEALVLPEVVLMRCVDVRISKTPGLVGRPAFLVFCGHDATTGYAPGESWKHFVKLVAPAHTADGREQSRIRQGSSHQSVGERAFSWMTVIRGVAVTHFIRDLLKIGAQP